MGTGLKPEIHNACYPEWLKRNANRYNVNHALILTLQPLYERKIQNQINVNCRSILCYNDIEVLHCHYYYGLCSLNICEHMTSTVRQTPDNLLRRRGTITHRIATQYSSPPVAHPGPGGGWCNDQDRLWWLLYLLLEHTHTRSGYEGHWKII